MAAELFKSKSSSLSSCQVLRWSITTSQTESISQPLFTSCDSTSKSQKESPLLQGSYSMGQGSDDMPGRPRITVRRPPPPTTPPIKGSSLFVKQTGEGRERKARAERH